MPSHCAAVGKPLYIGTIDIHYENFVSARRVAFLRGWERRVLRHSGDKHNALAVWCETGVTVIAATFGERDGRTRVVNNSNHNIAVGIFASLSRKHDLLTVRAGVSVCAE